MASSYPEKSRTPIPFDILTEIAEHLASFEDKHTLSSLSLTCAALRPICQSHLFHTITIPNHQPRGFLDKPQKFHTLLTESPQLTTYVKSVFYKHYRFDEQSKDIPAILDGLVNIESLDIRFYVGAMWDQFPILWLDTVMRLLQRPNLRTVGFANLKNLPIDVLARSGGLICFKAEQITTALSVPGQPVPKALALQELETTWGPNHERTAFVTLLPLCSSLRRLKCLFRMGNPLGFAQAVVGNIKDFGTLRVLQITTGHRFSPQKMRLLLHELEKVFESSPNSLHTFHWELPWDRYTGIQSTTKAAMKELNNIIARHCPKDSSSSLKTLQLQIHSKRYDEEDTSTRTRMKKGFIALDLHGAFANIDEVSDVELVIGIIP